MAATRAATGSAPIADRAARGAERFLRVAGDGRVGAGLLVVTGLVNLAAALVPGARDRLDAPPYAVLLGLVALSGIAAVAVRAPAAWREWRRPGPVHRGAGALAARVKQMAPAAVADALAAAGYRTRLEQGRRGWAVHGVRRGWSRFAGILSHLAIVVIVLGVAVGAAFGSETTFSLLEGDQALLDAPRAGFSDAVRLDGFDAEFDTAGRPQRLDTEVTFLRDGSTVERATLRVNQPGSFGGYLVHPWTYGPAARLRVATLGGGTLLDASIPLDGERDGQPVGATDLPSAGVSLGLALVDAEANLLGVSVVGASGLVDSARLQPGQSARLGDLEVELDGFDAWVTFLSRRDPGMPLLLPGGIGLCVSLAVGLWLPRRRLTLRPSGADLLIVLRGERFDRPTDELDRIVGRLDLAR
ncbi:MAG TPA: cytochrome c biogenesis protein ResB [Candidatus Limnocylindria bacterium]|nr:cytochrome c biogenesis protein ResB [Candidatus Limnocylindria bacterium]